MALLVEERAAPFVAAVGIAALVDGEAVVDPLLPIAVKGEAAVDDVFFPDVFFQVFQRDALDPQGRDPDRAIEVYLHAEICFVLQKLSREDRQGGQIFHHEKFLGLPENAVLDALDEVRAADQGFDLLLEAEDVNLFNDPAARQHDLAGAVGQVAAVAQPGQKGAEIDGIEVAVEVSATHRRQKGGIVGGFDGDVLEGTFLGSPGIIGIQVF